MKHCFAERSTKRGGLFLRLHMFGVMRLLAVTVFGWEPGGGAVANDKCHGERGAPVAATRLSLRRLPTRRFRAYWCTVLAAASCPVGGRLFPGRHNCGGGGNVQPRLQLP